MSYQRVVLSKHYVGFDRFVELVSGGESVAVAAGMVGVHPATGFRWARRAGLIRPRKWWWPRGDAVCRDGCDGLTSDDHGVNSEEYETLGRFLNHGERDRIAAWVHGGWSIRRIASTLCRAPSTISREIKRNSGSEGYFSGEAHHKAQQRAKRPKEGKLVHPGPLRDYVVDGLNHFLSPKQISSRIMMDHSDNPSMRVSAETIYQAIYVQARGGLRREVEKALRSGRACRAPHCPTGTRRRKARIQDMIMISERPAEADDRAVPGHWEGDLITGSGNRSAIGTLVERSTRYVMLVYLDGDHKAETVQHALVKAIQTLPVVLRRSLTWDQGTEMANHLLITQATDMPIYFCDPHSPWQRGSNENTNGLLRQYFPKGTDLSQWSPEHLEYVANELNNRPRATLGYLTPNEVLAMKLGLPVVLPPGYTGPRDLTFDPPPQ